MHNDREAARARTKAATRLHGLGLVDEESLRQIMRHSLASEIDASFLGKLERTSERKREMVNFVEWFW